MGKRGQRRSGMMVCLACLIATGCMSTPCAPPPATLPPHELQKSVLPDYVIEPPDILLIDAVTIAPKPPYHIATQDVLLIQVPNAFATDPISGLYPVEPGGTVNLGVTYGSVQVAGMTLEQAKAAIEDFLRPRIKDVKAMVALAQSRVLQQIRGQHLVTPDGKVRLGVYGQVPVVGMTVPQARAAIEAHLSQYLDQPELSVDVIGYNSKIYYVILDGGPNGQLILRLPITGNDTVLDALGQIGGLGPLTSRHRIWVARPAPEDKGKDQILPVDWAGITANGRVASNYQLMPGDRLYVSPNRLVAFDTILGRIYAPVERTFGLTLLGAGTISSVKAASGAGTSGQ
jgi:polysaccharide export outer membrane protein